MSLEEWRKNAWLKEHQSSKEEIANLFEIADRDIDAARTPDLVADWRFNIAYNACLQLATAALAASGYQAARAAHHFRVIQSLALTLRLGAAGIDALDGFRKKRNIADYERAEVVSDGEVDDIVTIAQKRKGRRPHPQTGQKHAIYRCGRQLRFARVPQRPRSDVEAWIRKHHSEYLD